LASQIFSSTVRAKHVVVPPLKKCEVLNRRIPLPSHYSISTHNDNANLNELSDQEEVLKRDRLQVNTGCYYEKCG
jgi:hypothetical protein